MTEPGIFLFCGGKDRGRVLFIYMGRLNKGRFGLVSIGRPVLHPNPID